MWEQCALALRECRLFESSDLEEVELRIGEVMQPHRLEPAGRYEEPRRAHMDYLALPSLGVGSIAFGEMQLKLEGVDDYHLVIFSMRGQARLCSGRDEFDVRESHGVCLAPGDPLRAHFSADCEQFVLRIDASALRRHSGMSRPRLHMSLETRSPLVGAWVNTIRAMLLDPFTLALIRQDSRVAADFENLFFSTLLGSRILGTDTKSVGAAPATVRRAEDYIDAHLAEPLSLPMIAQAARVPVRTLLASFSRFRGVSPVRHLHRRRLDAARDALLNAEADDNVLSIALNAGFSHLGRFAADYCRYFGEKPSQTLRRARGARAPKNPS